MLLDTTTVDTAVQWTEDWLLASTVHHTSVNQPYLINLHGFR